MSLQKNRDALNRISLAEANARLPRKVSFDGQSAKVVFTAVFLLFVVVIGCMWICHGLLGAVHTRNILRARGAVSNGVVTGIDLNHDGANIKYRFEADGVSYFGQAEMRGAQDKGSAPGDEIKILYLPNEPDVSQPSGWQWFSAWELAPILFMLLVAGASVAIIALALRERQLARTGLVVEGRVTGCASNQKAFKIYYEFTTADNVSIEGSSEMADEYEVGASIPVIYLRSDPKRNERYPLEGFVMEG